MTLLTTVALALACLPQGPAAPAQKPKTVEDAATSIQREIDRQIDRRLKVIQSNPVIRLPKGRFVLKHPISFRGTWGGQLTGQGIGTVLVADFANEDRGKPMIDLTGCTRFHIADLQIVGGPYKNPKDRSTPGVGILLARRHGESAGFHVIERVHFAGRFSVAALANIASEVNVFRDCAFTNNQAPHDWTDDGVPLGGYGVLISNHNYHNLIDAPMGAETMLEVTFDNCSFGLSCADLKGDPAEGGAAVLIAGMEKAVLGDIFFTSGGFGVTKAKAAVVLHAEGAHGQIERIVFDKMRCEVGAAEYCVLGVSSLPRDIGPVMWRDCKVYAGRQFMKFTGVAKFLGVDRTFVVRDAGRFPTFQGSAIEADRSRHWNIQMPGGAAGWESIVEVKTSMKNDRFVVPDKSLVKCPKTHAYNVKIDAAD